MLIVLVTPTLEVLFCTADKLLKISKNIIKGMGATGHAFTQTTFPMMHWVKLGRCLSALLLQTSCARSAEWALADR